MIPRTAPRRRTLLAVALLALAAGAAALLLLDDRREGWTAANPEARAALEEGERAQGRFYRQEAVERFEAALEADPDNVMARLFLLINRRHLPGGAERTKQLLDDLRAADLSPLSDRERLLVRFYLAQADREPERARALLEAYLAEHPDDPYAVELRCGWLWSRSDWDPAEACYRELTLLDPNRVEAQNRVGYIRMARGEFADAEAQFQIYRFLAPDQANPHDSMGELYLVTGRYGEAERELRQAVAIRPDFCASWSNLVLLERMRGDFAAAGRVLEEARRAGGCPADVLDAEGCRIELWRHAAAGRWEEAWQAAGACGDWPVDAPVAALAAAGAGRTGDLEALTAKIVEEYTAEGRDEEALRDTPTVRFLEAARAWSRDRPAAAAEHAARADGGLFYWTGQWHSKLLARRLEAAALERAGRTAEAAALEREIEAVHPGLATDPPFPLPPAGRGREGGGGTAPGPPAPAPAAAGPAAADSAATG